MSVEVHVVGEILADQIEECSSQIWQESVSRPHFVRQLSGLREEKRLIKGSPVILLTDRSGEDFFVLQNVAEVDEQGCLVVVSQRVDLSNVHRHALGDSVTICVMNVHETEVGRKFDGVNLMEQERPKSTAPLTIAGNL